MLESWLEQKQKLLLVIITTVHGFGLIFGVYTTVYIRPRPSWPFISENVVDIWPRALANTLSGKLDTESKIHEKNRFITFFSNQALAVWFFNPSHQSPSVIQLSENVNVILKYLGRNRSGSLQVFLVVALGLYKTVIIGINTLAALS